MISLSIISCESRYMRLVERELASGVRHDTLFFDIKFGQTRKEFFKKCWDLNKQGILRHGPKNMNVQYTLQTKESLGSDIAMLFYPKFDSLDRIYKMDVEYSFSAWAPWNKQFYAENLIPVMQDTLLTWYKGNKFMEIKLEDLDESIWVKIDGNRRISMKNHKDKTLLVKIIDMTH